SQRHGQGSRAGHQRSFGRESLPGLFVATAFCHTQPSALSSDPAVNTLPSVCHQNFPLLHSQEGVFVVALSCAWIIQDNLLSSGSPNKLQLQISRATHSQC
ncbi:mCG145238, partial [Mus musculus]